MSELASLAQETIPAQQSTPKEHGPWRFATVVFLFFSPLLVIGLVVEAILWTTGETWPIERVIAAQAKNRGAVFMRGMLDQGFYAYKLRNIAQRKPRLLVLGSSRVMEFRQEMFGETSFYNAGGMIQGLPDLAEFVARMDTAEAPEVVILGIDLWWLSGRHNPGSALTTGAEYDAARDWQAHLKAIRRFKSSKAYKPAFKALKTENDHIGIQAKTSSAGFRGDGSMQYHFAVPQSEAEWAFIDRENPPIPERIRTGEAPFLPNEGVEKERREMLAQVLAELRKKNVFVLGFLPPFSAEAAGLMETHPGQTKLWNEGRKQVEELFEQNGQVFVDASTTASLGLDDRYMIDGIHGAETLHVHLFQRFLKEPVVQQKFPGLAEKLTRLLAAKKTNYWHPDYSAAEGQSR